jgi:hypothetical protein
MAEEKLSSTSYSLAQQEMAALERQIADCDQEAVALKVASERAKEELKKLKTAEAGIKKQREAAMKDIEAAMKTAQKNASNVKAELAVVKNRRDALAAEVAAIQRDSASTKEQLKATEAAIERMTKELDTLTTQVCARFARPCSTPPIILTRTLSPVHHTHTAGQVPREV